jgi:hypothetical protein
MPLLQRIIEHLRNLVLVSEITMVLMAASVIIMSAAYAYCVIIKKSNYENIIIRVGVLVRILMLIGFTIEFSHQKAVYSGNTIMDGKFRAAEQFSNYLFYGYIFVIGIYDIFTIGINKFRGFFHTFDLTMLSMPILYTLTFFILNFKFNEEAVVPFLILASLLVLPFMFFKLYWKQNIKWYCIFLGYTVLALGIYKVLRFEILFTSTLAAYFLIGVYELSRHLFRKGIEGISASLWRKLKLLSITIPMVLVYSCIIALNISPLQIEKKYHINSYYKEDAAFTSLGEAERLARIAVEDVDSEIRHWQGLQENFNNRYMLTVGNYSVSINGATGKIFDITTINERKEKSQGNLSEQAIREKTIKWLQAVGFTYDEARIHIKILQQADKYMVNIYNRYNDGSVYERASGEIQWYPDGKLYRAGIGLGFSNIKDYKHIKIDEAIIENQIKAWYEKLGEETPAYALGYASYWFGELNPLINISCKNKDSFRISAETGKIMSFNRRRDNEAYNKPSFTEEQYNKYKERAEQLARTFSSSWDRHPYRPLENATHEYGLYTYTAENGVLINYIHVNLDPQGNMLSFNENSHMKTEFTSDKEFKVSSSDALKLVTSQYKPFGIYTKRVKLAAEIKEDGTANYKWMVMVIPFRDVEHQIYYVDTDTGKITPLLNYNR